MLLRFYPLSFFSRISLIFLALVLFACEPGSNQGTNAGYPQRPISFLVPWSPGGGTDISSRTLAVVLQNKLDQPINVVNRTGGGGVVGHLALSQARPDGYTLGAVTVEISMMHWMGLTPLSYKDYTPLAMTMNNPAAVTVKADAPWETLQDLVADIRANPGEFQASGTARGGIWDLARIGFLKAADLPENAVPWVPSQGAAPAMQELISGGVDIVTAALAEVDALRQAGQVKTLGIMSEERLKAFPDVPTCKEQGVDWSIGGWITVAAPAGLSDEVKTVLLEAIDKTVADTAFINSMTNAGFNMQYIAGDDLVRFMHMQDSVNGALMRSSGLSSE